MEKSGCALGWLLKLLGGGSEPGTNPADSLDPLPYKGKDFIFSRAERSFYEVLKLAVGAEYTIFAKVRMLDLVYLPKGTEKPQSWRNRVQSKHADFVLCEPRNLKPVIVVELDDASHDEADRESRDAFVDRVFQAAQIRVVHVKARATYSVDEVSRQVGG